MKEEIRKGWYSPKWWYSSVLPFLNRKFFKRYYDLKGRDNIMLEDWDNLILLDACRYDMFQSANNIEGELRKNISVGSSTPEFLDNTFTGEKHHDTVYVTANPQYRTRDMDDVFYTVVDVWDEAWDEDNGTVQPDVMKREVLECSNKYAQKRIFAHFMQPHYPFIGEKGNEIGPHAGYGYSRSEATGKRANRQQKTIWKQLAEEEIDPENVWDAYVENLEIVLGSVDGLVDSLTGKTVVTSDHGNLVYESYLTANYRKGHPSGVHVPELVEIPWLEIEGKDRKEIILESPKETKTTSSAVENRLKDLGYM